jgi:hypothetical protein
VAIQQSQKSEKTKNYERQSMILFEILKNKSNHGKTKNI